MRRKRQNGVTLIEILLALVVMMLGIVGILALFPVALDSAKTSMEETQAAMLTDSVAQSITSGLRHAWKDPDSPIPDNSYEVVMAHDNMRDGVPAVTYNYYLPALTDDWMHHPVPTPPSIGVPPTVGNPTADDIFSLRGDPWMVVAHETIRATNDMSDPYHQFAFSFDIRKINSLEYLLTRTNPATGAVYTESDLEGMCTLFELRIHVFRKIGAEAAGGGGDTQSGVSAGTEGSLDLISTVVHRVSKS